MNRKHVEGQKPRRKKNVEELLHWNLKAEMKEKKHPMLMTIQSFTTLRGNLLFPPKNSNAQLLVGEKKMGWVKKRADMNLHKLQVGFVSSF